MVGLSAWRRRDRSAGRAPAARRAPSGEFEYVFPAIRGVQAGREYYVTMCPLRIIPRLFLFNEEELPPEMRAQRSLNKSRVPEMARYIVENPDSYIFSALTRQRERRGALRVAGRRQRRRPSALAPSPSRCRRPS